MINIILINGPPTSGKDHFYKYLDLCYSNLNLKHLKFAQPIRDFIKATYGLSDWEINEYKDKIHKSIGKTVREVMIEFSENFIKRFHGKEFFADRCAEKAFHLTDNSEDLNTIVITDCGFQYEVDRFINKFTEIYLHENQYLNIPEDFSTQYVKFYLVKLYGRKDFSNDSREYIDLPNIPTTEITNTYNKDFHQEIDNFLKNNNII